MALFKFTDAILNDRPIDVYNHGKMKRDFTYVDDLVRALSMLIDAAPITGQPASDNDSLSPVAPFRVLNIGNNSPVELGDFIRAIECSCGKTAVKNLMPMQAGDVPATWADTSLLHALTQYKPSTTVAEGVDHFVRWYRAYYGI
jgi:UDP-glucuronate 4-epimerase